MKNKILAVICCALLCAAMMPVAALAQASYAVTYVLDNVTTDGPAVTDGTDLVLTLYAADGYMMTNDIAVTVGGAALNDGYTYTVGQTMVTASLAIPADSITGDVVITSSAAAKYDVVFNGEMWTAAAPVPMGTSLNAFYGSPDLTLEKDGYVFEGWFESTDGGETFAATPFDFDTVPTGSVELYPKWTPITTTTSAPETTTTAVTTTTTAAPAPTATTASPTTTPSQKPMTSPQTGHAGLLIVSMAATLFAAAGIVLVLRQRQHG